MIPKVHADNFLNKRTVVGTAILLTVFLAAGFAFLVVVRRPLPKCELLNAAPDYQRPPAALETLTLANVSRLAQVAQWNPGRLTSIAWSPACAGVAVSSTVGVWLYDAEDPQARPYLFAVQGAKVLSVAFNADGSLLAASGQTTGDRPPGAGKVWLWSTQTGEVVGEQEVPELPVNKITFTPAGGLHGVGFSAYEPRLLRAWQFTWDTAATGQHLIVHDLFSIDPQVEVRAVALDATGLLLAAGGGSLGCSRCPSVKFPVQLWNVMTGESLQRFDSDLVSDIALSPNGELLALIGSGMQLVESKTGKVRATFAPAHTAAFSANGHWLAFAIPVPDRSASVLHLYDLQSGEDRVLSSELEQYILFLAFSPDGSQLAIGEENARTTEQRVRLWNVPGGNLRNTLLSGPGVIEQVFFSPNDLLLISKNWRTLSVWDLAAGKLRLGPISYDNAFALSPATGPGVWLALAMVDNSVQIWDLRTGERVTTLTGHLHPTRSLAFSPDGQLLVSADDAYAEEYFLADNSTVRFWDTTHWTMRATLPGRGKLTFNPEGTLLAAANEDAVQVWDVATQRLLEQLQGEFAQEPYTALFSPAGTHLLYGRGWQRVVHDLQTRTDLYQVKASWMQTFSPDGQLLVTDPDQRLMLWDMPTGAIRATLETDAGFFTKIVFAAQGRLLVAESLEDTWVWDMTTYRLFAKLKGQTGAILNPAESLLAAADLAGQIHLWDTQHWTEIATLPGHNGAVGSLVFSADGKLLISASSDFGDGSIRLWGVSVSSKP